MTDHPLSSQAVGRLGELAVEHELINRGWRAGNYNSSTTNQAAYDIFAAKGSRRIEIRVKSYTAIDASPQAPGNAQYNAKKDGTIFRELTPGDDSDFCIIVGIYKGDATGFYIIPAHIAEAILRKGHEVYLSGTKPNGEPRKDTSLRRLVFDAKDDSPRPNHGLQVRWAEHLNAWHLLEG